jgi:hypothetical protein
MATAPTRAGERAARYSSSTGSITYCDGSWLRGGRSPREPLGQGVGLRLQFGLQFTRVRPSSPEYAHAVQPAARTPANPGEHAPLKLTNPRVRGSSPWRRTCENLPKRHTAVEPIVEPPCLATLRWPHGARRDRSHRATAERRGPTIFPIPVGERELGLGDLRPAGGEPVHRLRGEPGDHPALAGGPVGLPEPESPGLGALAAILYRRQVVTGPALPGDDRAFGAGRLERV